MHCLLNAWNSHQPELRTWLRRQLRGDMHYIDDLLQEIFLKALRQDKNFCAIDNSRAWFFQVARNIIIDHWRVQRELVELPEDLSQPESDVTPTVDNLSICLPRALTELSAADSEAITRCDLEGMSQAEFARLHGITLVAAKSRVQRARQRLREHLTRACQVRFDANGSVCCFVPRPAVNSVPDNH